LKAVIISCSEGTRLRPLTCSTPKTMLPVMGRPIIEHTVRLLNRHNIQKITVAADYLSDEIKKHFSFAEIKGVDIDFTHVQNLENFFCEDDTIVISDSIITDLNIDELYDFHKKNSASATLVTSQNAQSYEYGSIQCSEKSSVLSYTRSPDFTYPTGSSFMGVALVSGGTKVSDCTDMETLAEKLCTDCKGVFCYSPKCYIRDVSDFDSYQRCIRDFFDKKISLPFPCDEKAPSVWVDESATIMQGAVIVPPVYIGSGSLISKGARIESYTQICRDVTVDCHAGIKRSTIMDNSCISEGCSLRGAFIGKSCTLASESAAYEGSVIGSGTKIGKRCILRTSVHIWPDKFIEDESCISENIIWESSSRHSMFCDGAACGVINREITPEFAASLGRSVAALLGKKIAVSCDGSGGGSMIKNALIAGIQSGGGVPYDFGEQPLPITRSAIRFHSLCGGIAFSTYIKDGQTYATLDIINSLGADMESADVQKIESLVSTGSAKRVSSSHICESEFMFEYKLYYLKQLINSTSKKPLGARLLIYCPSPWAKELLKSAASDLNCNFTFTEEYDMVSFAKQVSSGGYDMGAVCDHKCEALTLVTKAGRILSEFDYCALSSLIIMKTFPDASIYIPESAPESIETLAQKYSARVYRTPVSPPYLMNELSKSKRKLFMQQFIYRFDAVGAIIILIDYLYTSGLTLEALMSEIPPSNIVTTTVSCSNQEQPEIMQQLYLRHHLRPSEKSQAVKINFENGWVLVIPKRNESAIQLISHGFSKEYAEELADICMDDILRR